MNENKTKINETKLLIFEKYPLKIGNKTEHMVFSIPSEFLRYNVLNGRIASNVDSSEAVKNHIDMNNNKKILEDFLWHSDIKANKKTKNSIFEDGQQKPGIITADGIVLDGNRRLMLLNKIYEETGDIRYSRFNAVILDENLTKKEIYNLEAYLQFGIDPQLEYGSIEKYLMINRRIDAGLSVKEISKSFNGKFSENEIKELIYRFELMEEYLEYIGHKGNYELLSFRKVEDSIKTLAAQIKKLKKNTHSAQKRWSISDDEISDIKLLYFDLIRLAVSSDPKDYRSLILNKNNLLENKEEWKKFSDNHFEFTKEIDRLTEDYYVDLDNSPQSKNLSSLEKIKITETKLEEHFKNELYSNLQNSLRTVEFINSNNSTLNELKVIYSKLQKVVDEYDESKVNKEGIHKYVKLIFDLLDEF
jgi:hypothetical protein